jgi:hypothetical protein
MSDEEIARVLAKRSGVPVASLAFDGCEIYDWAQEIMRR